MKYTRLMQIDQVAMLAVQIRHINPSRSYKADWSEEIHLAECLMDQIYERVPVDDRTRLDQKKAQLDERYWKDCEKPQPNELEF